MDSRQQLFFIQDTRSIDACPIVGFAEEDGLNWPTPRVVKHTSEYSPYTPAPVANIAALISDKYCGGVKYTSLYLSVDAIAGVTKLCR